MKIAVIGVGYWGKKHVDEWTRIPGIEVVVADPDEKSRKYCEDKYKVKTLKDYKALLADKELKAVSIAAPNPLHYPIAKEFLEAGKHVLVEKPICLKAEQAQELIDIAKEKNLTLMTGHVHRYNNAIRKIKQMIDKKEFGKIYTIKMRWVNMEPLYPDRDVIFDLAPHPYDLINFFFNEDPDEVSCAGGAYRRREGAEAVSINCKLDD